MTGQENEQLDNWDGFLGSNFLGAENVENEDQEFVVVGAEMDRENQRPILNLETKEGKEKYLFSLNVTNSKFIQEAGINSPKDSIGKKLTFRKVMVQSPKKKQEVESLRIKTVK